MNPTVSMALKKASAIRKEHNFNIYQPVNIFDLCINMDITVRFVDINMEGMYFSQQDGMSPQILISNQRPLQRRMFTCAHELGHHIFGHGSKVDLLVNNESGGYNEEEFLVDTFAGSLLMPITGVMAEFAKRNLNINQATPKDFLTISSVFGTGYQTLITHCLKNKILNDFVANSLSKITPAKILHNIIDTNEITSHFKIIDEFYSATTVDLEVENVIILPNNSVVDSMYLRKYKEIKNETAYIAEKSGITRVTNSNGNNYFVRIQSNSYIGLAEFRHLEQSND